MREIRIGLLGFGTVGGGVAEALLANRALLAERTGLDLRLAGIADLDIETDRGVAVDRALLTRDAEALIDSPETDVIIELIGGTTIARKLILRALERGKPVITANKALLAEYGDEIFRLAEEKGVDVYYEASVGGGIPVIKALREGLVGNHVESIVGILNGTCNYILTRMESEKLPFDEVLKAAQAAGYAEAEPALDVDGIDTAHKAVILASLAYGIPIVMSDVHIEGIRGMAALDIACARELGYRVKLLAVMKHREDAVEVRVHPALVPLDHMLASVSGVFNAVMIRGDVAGDTLYYGRGAGRKATASAVVADLVDVGLNLATGAARRVRPLVRHGYYGKLRSIGETAMRHYLRLTLLDQPGTLARVAEILGRHNIGIASVLQKENSAGKYVPVILLTTTALERNMQSALNEINGLDVTGDKTVRIRIEDFS